MRRFILFMSVVIVLLLSATAIGDIEPNDDFDNAEQIAAGSYDGELDCGWFGCDDYDYYKVTLVAGQIIYVNVTSTPETSVTLKDEQKDTKDYSGTETSHEVLWVTSSSAPSSFICYIKVHRLNGEGPYDMEVSVVSQDDANSGGDAGDRYDTATLVSDGIRYSGYANSLYYDTDYYAIGIQQGSKVTIDLWSNDEESALASVDDEERHYLSALSVEYGAHDNVTFEVSEPQTVYLQISTIGTYDFQITLNPIDSTDDLFDDGAGFDVLSLLWSWLPYIIGLLVLVFIVVAIAVVVKKR